VIRSLEDLTKEELLSLIGDNGDENKEHVH